MTPDALPEVFSAREIARAAGVRVRDVKALLAADGTAAREVHFFTERDAVRLVRSLRTRDETPREMFATPARERRRAGLPLAASGTVHAAFAGVIILLTMGFVRPASENAPARVTPMRLVFLTTPGPGGGGGGGGRNAVLPPPKAEREGRAALRSPIPIRRPPPVRPPVQRVSTPPPLHAEPLPPVVAPVVAIAADQRDRIGVLEDARREEPSPGSGTDGGTGAGNGTGVGEGTGPGIGDGSGGGTGGGPYRPGSGITPPSLLREVKPDYTEEGRQRNVEGDVVLEIVVRSDGRVGDVKLLQGLGAGLDQRAIDAVRQWRFSPATRLGTPVDVIVEVAVEFKLR
jgi:TonB family protein